MLVRDPDDRITMAQIHKHPWFIANLPMEVSLGGVCSSAVYFEFGYWDELWSTSDHAASAAQHPCVL
jgi:hypothetical protein